MDARWIERFEDFGEDPFLPCPRMPLSWIKLPAEMDPSRIPLEDRLAFLKRSVCEGVPRVPGVYGMLDSTGRLIYVGKSKALRNRLLSYFLPNNEEDKSGRIAQAAYQIVWERQPSEFAALLREQSLIRRWQPRMNVVGMPKRQKHAFLCLGKGPAESFYLSRYHDSTAKFSVGPLSGLSQLTRAVEILTRYFKLRDCSQKTPILFSEQLTLFEIEHRAGCVRHELGSCIAPCLPNSSRSLYQQKIQAALAYLQSGDEQIEASIQSAMERAAAGLHFEQATVLREDLRIMKWLAKKLRQFQNARESKPTLLCLPTFCDYQVWYLIQRGGVLGVFKSPSDGSQWKSLRKQIDRLASDQPEVGLTTLNPEDTLGLVTSWLQKKENKPEWLRGAPKPSDNLPRAWTCSPDLMPTQWRELHALLHPTRATQKSAS